MGALCGQDQRVHARKGDFVMIVAGCDVGSLTTKAVILNNTRIISHALIPSSFNPEKSAPEVMDMALSAAGLTMKDIGFCVGTGYGRERIPFVGKAVSEIACHAKGQVHHQ
jgi:activator of 2-hydroxyglutaryl-CoA dehydratase